MTAYGTSSPRTGCRGRCNTDRARLTPTCRPRAQRRIAPSSPRWGAPSRSWGLGTSSAIRREPAGAVSARTARCKGGPVNELRVGGIRPLAAANGYLTERFMADYDQSFGRPPWIQPVPLSWDTRPGSYPVSRRGARGRPRQRRGSRPRRLADRSVAAAVVPGWRVPVRRHLDGRRSGWWGPPCVSGASPLQGDPSRLRPPNHITERTDHLSNVSGQVTC